MSKKKNNYKGRKKSNDARKIHKKMQYNRSKNEPGYVYEGRRKKKKENKKEKKKEARGNRNKQEEEERDKKKERSER